MGMPTLKNMVQVVNLAPGIPTTYAHALQDTDGRALLPDHVYAPTNADLVVTNADATNITVINQGFAQASGSILVESWHTENRVFPGTALTLAGLPYIANNLSGGGIADRLSIGQQVTPVVNTQRLIYATVTGSDVAGDGSAGNPYRTFLRAIEDVPLNIKQGEQWIIDLTDLGIENLGGTYVLPQFIGSQGTPQPDFGAPTYIESLRGDVTIRAIPTDVLTIPGANITGQVADATTGHITVQTNLALVPGAHVGQIIQGAGLFETYVVVSNTATDIETTSGAVFTPDITLQTQSATLRNSDGASIEPAIRVARTGADIAFAGIAFDHANAAAGAEALHATISQGEVQLLACWTAGLQCELSYMNVSVTYVSKALRLVGFNFVSFASFYDGVNNDNDTTTDAIGEHQFFLDVWDSPATPIGRRSGTGGNASHLEMDSCIVRGATGFGIQIEKARADLISCLIENGGAAGVRVDEGGFVFLNGCNGLLNTTLGVQILNGGLVNVTGVLGLTGAAGDYQCGGNAAAAGGGAGWAALVSENDLAAGTPQLCRAYR